ncbi:MAG: VanZ family protein [Deltaproteobacteria bacterium]|nr:VanZ family protein [Deltaproteobacteria bacterium]
MIRSLILFFYYYVPVILYLLLIYTFSSLSIEIGTIPLLNHDKILHILEYAVLGFLFMRAYLNSVGSSFKIRGVLTSAFFSFLFGCSDEYHQLYVPNRIVSIGDILADTIGGFIGSIFYIVVLYVISWKEKKYGKAD